MVHSLPLPVGWWPLPFFSYLSLSVLGWIATQVKQPAIVTLTFGKGSSLSEASHLFLLVCSATVWYGVGSTNSLSKLVKKFWYIMKIAFLVYWCEMSWWKELLQTHQAHWKDECVRIVGCQSGTGSGNYRHCVSYSIDSCRNVLNSTSVVILYGWI